jgi:hypothetical protein
VYQSPSDSDYELLDVMELRSVVGRTETPLLRAPSGRYDNGAGLRVKLMTGTLSSVEEQVFLAGANLAAIGDGTSGAWEVLQFGQADLVDKDTYMLTRRLRGQLGTDGLMPDLWPEGSWFVLMNGMPEQIDLLRNLRRVQHSYRIGPARRGVDDPSYVEQVEAFEGNGLRPYTPVHLRATINQDGAIETSWIRRTRIDGDAWETPDVPLGEETESYVVHVVKDGELLRETSLHQPFWIYPLSEQAVDGLTGSFEIRVAQISAAYGAGPASVLPMSV